LLPITRCIGLGSRLFQRRRGLPGQLRPFSLKPAVELRRVAEPESRRKRPVIYVLRRPPVSAGQGRPEVVSVARDGRRIEPQIGRRDDGSNPEVPVERVDRLAEGLSGGLVVSIGPEDRPDPIPGDPSLPRGGQDGEQSQPPRPRIGQPGSVRGFDPESTEGP